MLKKVCQGWKSFFPGLITEGKNQSKTAPLESRSVNNPTEDNQQKSSSQLADTEYEFLFTQLLEGVAHGWQSERIFKFFDQLGERGKQEQWIQWLHHFGERVVASPAPNRELATRMLKLGEQTRLHSSLKAIGETSYNIGMQLLNKGKQREIWEYDGPDASTTPSEEQEELQMLTLEQLLMKLQQDSNLSQQIAQQLGIEQTDPQAIIQQIESQIKSNDPVAWFNDGLSRANAGDLEGAIACWDQAIAIKPDFKGAWYNRGSALAQLKCWEEAIASYEKTLEIKPDDSEAWYNRGVALKYLGQPKEAIASYNKALAITPNFQKAIVQRDQVLKQLEKSNKA